MMVGYILGLPIYRDKLWLTDRNRFNSLQLKLEPIDGCMGTFTNLNCKLSTENSKLFTLNSKGAYPSPAVS